jgi:serine/threonine protein kinase
MAVPKKNELLRGYTLLEDFKIVGGGTCQWTFATKDGDEYFIKMFLDPRLPSPDGLGSEKVKNQRRERCRTFERHQRDLMERVRKLVGAGGNLIAPIDFFEFEGQYYKIARKVSASIGAEKEVPTRSIQDRITLCINVCSALQSLHNNKIVHGDLKLDNILLQKSSDGGFLAKVIDFDSSYVVGAPPSSEEILGDPPYYSPELLDYIQGRSTAESLTTASDIFSLGIVFCEYLTGAKPHSTGDHNYLSEAVRSLETITIPGIPENGDKQTRLHEILRKMISINSSERPALFGLSNELKTIRDGSTGPVAKPDELPSDSVARVPATSNELDLIIAVAKTYLDKILSKGTAVVTASSSGGSRLRGTLSKLPEAPPTSEDKTALITAMSEISSALQKLAES